MSLLAANEDAVFFDVLGLFVAYFPESWAWPLAAATCVVLVAVRRLEIRFTVRRANAWVLTLLAILVAAGLSAALGWGLTRGLSAAGLLPRIHVAHGRWIAALYWPLSLGILWFVGRGVLRRSRATEVWAAFWLVWSFAALAVALRLPGFCHMLLVPALVAALLSLLPVSASA